MELLVVLGCWMLSPVPLLILWLMSRTKEKKRTALIQRLYADHRILPEEMIAAGVPLPKQQIPAGAVPVLPETVPQPAVPSQPADPQRSLEDAAARAAKIAEAEISGEAFTAETLAAELAAEKPAVPESIQPADVLLPDEAISSAVTERAAHEAPVPAEAAVPAGTEAPVPESAPAAADAAQPENAAAEAPEIRAAADMTPPAAAAPLSVPVLVKELPNKLSAITLMLSVGVLLVIVAGLIFVRTAWSSLTDGGRLATLAAGSVLFFGTSALARRVWKLERTGMAFFTLGAAFMPISVWAAGYLNLLGDGLSGAGNPWLIALAFASFTVISLVAVFVYRQKSWGIAFLCGLTVTYISLAEALTLHRDTMAAPFLIAVAAYALLLAFGARLLSMRIPQEIGSVLEPFSLVLGILSAAASGIAVCIACGYLLDLRKPEYWIYAVPAFLAAFVFFSPAFTEKLKELTALPVTLLAVPGFMSLLIRLYRTVFCEMVYDLESPVAYSALILMLCALLWLILLLTNSLPDETRRGFLIGSAVLTVLSIFVNLCDHDYVLLRATLTMAAAGVLLLAGWLVAARKAGSKANSPLHFLIGGQVWMLCIIVREFVFYICDEQMHVSNYLYNVLGTLCFLTGFAVLVLTKKHRTWLSDLLLTLSPVFPLLSVIDLNADPKQVPVQWCALIILLGLVLLYWVLALAGDTRKPHQYAYAVLSPLLLLVTAVAAGDGLLEDTPDLLLPVCWSIFSYLLGTAAYFTTKKRFHGVRMLLFGLTMVTPILTAFCIEIAHPDPDNVMLQLLGTAAAAGLWLLFSNRGFRAPAVASFSAALCLLLEMTGCQVYHRFYDGTMNYTVLLISSVWIMVFSLLAIALTNRMLFFVGSNVIPAVMQFAAPLSALFLSFLLAVMPPEYWESFYFVYVLGLSVLAWFTTKKSQIILPAVCAFSLVLTVESLRNHTFRATDGSAAVMILMFCVMTILFPYLGMVLRESDEEPKQMRRSYVLTGMGALMPSWLLLAAQCGTHLGSYTHEQQRWMYFFVPILISGYLLHFLLFNQDAQQRRMLMTAAAGFGVIAFWMQPLVDVSDTWLEGKLHIVPLFAFGLLIRYLYGKDTGGIFLFGVGLYTMLRLSITAMITEEGADLLTLLVTALVMFIASFYIRQKKWFLLGGISLVLTAVYMHMKLTEGRQWWAYLLLAGLLLIVVAGSNEMLKQRGDSLKSRAGRLMDDWTW